MAIFVSFIFLNAQNPELTGINPNAATIPELLTVEISGSNTNFAMGTGTVVWFNQGSNTIFPMSVNEINNYLLEAEFLFTNTKVPGVYDVHTHNNYDGHLVLPDAFTLNPNPNPPYLVSITPSSAYAGEMVTVTITAENTNFTQGVYYAYLYKNYTYLIDHSINIISDETIVVEFPITSGSPTGLYNLRVKSAWDGSIFLYDAFMVFPDPDPPSLTEIVPDNATIPETLTVTISGNGTHFTQATGTTVKFKQGSSTIYPNTVVEVNDTELLAQFTFDDFDNPGYYDVNTYNALDGDLYLYNAFYLYPNPNPPQLISIEPDSAQPGDNLEVSISGQNTSFTQGTGTTVWLNMGYNYIYPYSTTVINDELVNASFLINSIATLGSYDVNTHNWANGNLVLEDAFEIIDTTTSIQYNELFKTLKIYPNPTNGKIIISFELDNSDYVSLQLCDFYGNTLYEERFDKNKIKHEELVIPSLVSGVYYLKFSSNSSVVTKKVIVK